MSIINNRKLIILKINKYNINNKFNHSLISNYKLMMKIIVIKVLFRHRACLLIKKQLIAIKE